MLKGDGLTNDERAAAYNKANGTAWNGSLGWTYGPSVVFVIAVIAILAASWK